MLNDSLFNGFVIRVIGSGELVFCLRGVSVIESKVLFESERDKLKADIFE
jgi:hypothetical protein